MAAKIERSIADSILLDLVEQGAMTDLEAFRGVRAIASRGVQRPPNQIRFERAPASLQR